MVTYDDIVECCSKNKLSLFLLPSYTQTKLRTIETEKHPFDLPILRTDKLPEPFMRHQKKVPVVIKLLQIVVILSRNYQLCETEKWTDGSKEHLPRVRRF